MIATSTSIVRRLYSALRSQLKIYLGKRGIHVTRTPARGCDFLWDLKHRLPRAEMRVVFDVGGYDGRSTAAFLDAFPAARVWCFEPNLDLHPIIVRRLAKRMSRVKLERTALAASAGTATLHHVADASMSFIARPGIEVPQALSVLSGRDVLVETLDRYCEATSVGRIDLLKIDTEGHDLEVLKGAEALLARGDISYIQCEAAMSPENHFHVRFEDMKEFLEHRSYRLFAIYEQVEEWTLGAPHLRRVNAAFVPATSGTRCPEAMPR